MAEALRLQNIATSKKIINIFKRNHVYIQAHYSMKQGGGGGHVRHGGALRLACLIQISGLCSWWLLYVPLATLASDIASLYLGA